MPPVIRSDYLAPVSLSTKIAALNTELGTIERQLRVINISLTVIFVHVNIINMKNQAEVNGKRPYRKSRRAEREAATYDAILNAAFKEFSTRPFDRVTLKQIASQCGVTVQTVIRRFGSKEELFEELAKREGERILAERHVPREAGLKTALGALLEHYERDGDTIANFVAQEHLFEPVRGVVERGRRVHREWVELHCEQVLAGCEGRARERAIHAAIVATDLSTWKLLRRDLGLKPAEVAAVMSELLCGLDRRE